MEVVADSTRGHLAGVTEMLEVGIGLGLGHAAPRPLLEELVRQLDHAGLAQRVRCVSQLLEPLGVVVLDLLAAAGDVGELEPVSGQREREVAETGDAVEACLLYTSPSPRDS